MKNLKESRLGYEYTNMYGDHCKVISYKSNKAVVVFNEKTGKNHKCRWHDLYNPKCKAVYDISTDISKVKKESINSATPDDISKKIEQEVRESEQWCYSDELAERYPEDYCEGNHGCLLVWAALAVVLISVAALIILL